MSKKPHIEGFIEKLIKEHAEFARYWYIVGIVDEPKGIREDSKYFKNVYTTEGEALSDSGDDFRGTCYIGLPSGKYLRTEYYT